MVHRWNIQGCEAPFVQLLSIHAFLRQGDVKKQVPLTFVLMSGRNKSDYKAVFVAVKGILGSSRLEEAVLDFEAAMWGDSGLLSQTSPLRDVCSTGCRVLTANCGSWDFSQHIVMMRQLGVTADVCLPYHSYQQS